MATASHVELSLASAQGSRRAIRAATIGTLISGYDSLLFGYFASILATRFFPPGHPTAALLNTFAIFAVGFAVRPLGGAAFGHVGDRWGRRGALVLSIILLAAATLAIGVLPTYATAGVLAPALLLACRLVQGFAVGGEYIGANVLILEHASPRRAGRAVSANQVAGYLGIAAAAGTSLVLAAVLSSADLSEWGWRVPFLAALPLAVVGVYLRLRIPESPEFERAREEVLPFPLLAALRGHRRGFVVYGTWFAMVGLGGYLLHGYLATYLIRVVGLGPETAFAANLVTVLTLAAGAVVGGVLVDRYPPRAVAIGAATGIGLTAVPGFLVIQRGGLLAAMIGSVPVAFAVGVAATFGATLAVSQFPPPVRYSATAVAHSVSVTVFGSTAPYVSTWLVVRAGATSPAWYVSVMALVALTVPVWALRAGGAASLDESR
jgi:MFS transporter, MHS family, proline/betaine transporter